MHSMAVNKSRNRSAFVISSYLQQLKGMQRSKLGVPFVNRRYTKQVLFLLKIGEELDLWAEMKTKRYF